MRAFIRAVSLLSIGIYLLFSQFVVKALVTTAIPPESRGEAWCVMKNLDTFDWKYWCRKDKNNGTFEDGLQLTINEVADARYLEPYQFVQNVEVIENAHIDPPPDWAIPNIVYAQQYVWVVLLLL